MHVSCGLRGPVKAVAFVTFVSDAMIGRTGSSRAQPDSPRRGRPLPAAQLVQGRGRVTQLL